MKNWNGRFQGVGGGGFSGGSADGVVAAAARGVRGGIDRHGPRRRLRKFRARQERTSRLAAHPRQRLSRHPRDDRDRQGARAGVLRRGAAARRTGTAARPAADRASAKRSAIPPTTTAFSPARRPSTGRSSTSSRCGRTVVMLDLNYVIAPCKYVAATQAAIAACDMHRRREGRRARGSESVHLRSEGARRHDDATAARSPIGRGRHPRDLGRTETARRIVPLVRTRRAAAISAVCPAPAARHSRRARTASPRVVEVLPQ